MGRGGHDRRLRQDHVETTIHDSRGRQYLGLLFLFKIRAGRHWYLAIDEGYCFHDRHLTVSIPICLPPKGAEQLVGI